MIKLYNSSIRNNSKGSFIFSDAEDRPIYPSNFRSRNWEKDLKRAKIRHIRIHDARHTYASLFMMNGGKLYDLKTVLGHADMKTTERYAHLSNEHLAGVKDIIQPRIENYASVIEAKRVDPIKPITQNRSRSIHATIENALVSSF